MAVQQKQKTRRKVVAKIKKGHRPWSAKTQHDEMVVFPTASGKLATTWMKNVDNIISEGTGDISADKLKVMKGKLQTALDIVSHRLADEELKQMAKDSDAFRMSCLTKFMKDCTGNVVRIRRHARDVDNSFGTRNLLVCKAEINKDSLSSPVQLCIEGLIFDPLTRDVPAPGNLGYMPVLAANHTSRSFKEHSRVSQFQLVENVHNINIKKLDGETQFSIEFPPDHCPYDIDVGVLPNFSEHTLLKFLGEFFKMASIIPELKNLNNIMSVPEEKKEEEPKCKKKTLKLKLRRKSVPSEP